MTIPQLNTKQKAILSIIVIAIAFALGRYTVPVKIKTEIKTIYIEKTDTKVSTSTEKKKKKKVTIVEDDSPNGTKHKVTTITDDTDSDHKSDTSTVTAVQQTTDATKEVKKDSGHLNLSLLTGASVLGQPGINSGIIYGGHITRDIFGPLNIGVWGLSNGTAGLSIGLRF